jgi:hypothetical protein
MRPGILYVQLAIFGSLRFESVIPQNALWHISRCEEQWLVGTGIGQQLHSFVNYSFFDSEGK